MTTTTVQVQVAARHQVNPRGAEALGEFAALVFRAVSRLYATVAPLRAGAKHGQGVAAASC